jgi:hypothetical protein
VFDNCIIKNIKIELSDKIANTIARPANFLLKLTPGFILKWTAIISSNTFFKSSEGLCLLGGSERREDLQSEIQSSLNVQHLSLRLFDIESTKLYTFKK